MPEPPPADDALASALHAEATEIALLLDALMEEPIKRPAQITVLGDDSVVGIDPAPISREP